MSTPIFDSDFSSSKEDKKSGNGEGDVNDNDVDNDDDDDNKDDDYDCKVAIVGSGPESLFCAALLVQPGRSVVVLCPDSNTSGCLSIFSSPSLSSFSSATTTTTSTGIEEHQLFQPGGRLSLLFASSNHASGA